MGKGKDREELHMNTLKEKVIEANKKVDLRIDDIWKQAEENLKQSEIDFYNRKERTEKE